MRKVPRGAGMAATLLAGVALVVGAQGPPPGGPFGGPGQGPGGPMPGMFEFGGLMGGFGGRVVTGKPILATITITHTETLPGNMISSTTTGTFARGADWQHLPRREIFGNRTLGGVGQGQGVCLHSE